MPSAESRGESFARPTRCSTDMLSVMGLYDIVVGSAASDSGNGNTGAKIVAGGVEIVDGSAKIVADGKVGASSCFFSFLSHRRALKSPMTYYKPRNRCPLNLETLPKTERPEI